MLNSSRFNYLKLAGFLVVAIAVFFLTSIGFAQTTVGTGSIVGTVTDPSGAFLPGAEVVITNAQTGQKITIATNAAGAYNS